MRPAWIICLFLLTGPLWAQSACPRLPLPSAGDQWLRHEKHALLAFGTSAEGQDEAWLVTRKAILRRPFAPSSAEKKTLLTFRDLFRRHPRASSQTAPEVMDLAHESYRILVAPFRKELDQLYQISIFPGHRLTCDLPFEALVIDADGQPGRRRFLTEIWAVSYIRNPSFRSLELRENNPEVAWDLDGTYTGDRFHPDQGTVLSNAGGFDIAVQEPVRSRFRRLLEEGFYVDEALGRARSAHFDSLRRSLSEGNSLPEGLDPRFWAHDHVLGDIVPVHQSLQIPWWLLVPLGFLFVIFLGRKL